MKQPLSIMQCHSRGFNVAQFGDHFGDRIGRIGDDIFQDLQTHVPEFDFLQVHKSTLEIRWRSFLTWSKKRRSGSRNTWKSAVRSSRRMLKLAVKLEGTQARLDPFQTSDEAVRREITVIREEFSLYCRGFMLCRKTLLKCLALQRPKQGALPSLKFNIPLGWWVLNSYARKYQRN